MAQPYADRERDHRAGKNLARGYGRPIRRVRLRASGERPVACESFPRQPVRRRTSIPRALSHLRREAEFSCRRSVRQTAVRRLKGDDILVSLELTSNGFVILRYKIVRPRSMSSAFSISASALNQ